MCVCVYALYTGCTSLRAMEGEASGVRRNARNWNDQLFDSRGASLGAKFSPSFPLSLSSPVSSKKQVET